jgi:dihydroorotate dehydrogenase electron transfer subunit
VVRDASIPATRGQFVSTVADNIPLCREHWRLILTLPEFPQTDPGQFIQISCRSADDDFYCDVERTWPPEQLPLEVPAELEAALALLRRPFSLAGRSNRAHAVELHIIHRVVGVGTDWLSRLKRGDRVGLLGPLGNRFALPPANATALLVGGGVGIPPMLYLAERLAGRPAIAFCGALTRDLLPLTITGAASATAEPKAVLDEFARHGIASVVSTDDGSYGFRGFVTQALQRHLEQADYPVDARPMVYTCGPEPMMKRVAEIAAGHGLSVQIAVERAMACGMGTCQSCVIRVRKPDAASGWVYRLACTDGPVFKGEELLW